MRIFRLGMGEIKSLHSCTVKHSVYIFIETRSSQRLNRSNKYQKYVVFPSSGGIIRPQSQIQLGTTKPWEPCECIDRLKHNTSLWNWFDFHRIVPEQEWQKIRQEYLNTDWTGGLLVKVHLCFWTRYLALNQLQLCCWTWSRLRTNPVVSNLRKDVPRSIVHNMAKVCGHLNITPIQHGIVEHLHSTLLP